MRGVLRSALVAMAALPIAGCAIPPALSVASLVADSASYVSSGKSMTDHGISALMDEDCALLRIFDGDICRETPDYDETTVAVLEPRAPVEPVYAVASAPGTGEGRAPVVAVSAEPLAASAPSAAKAASRPSVSAPQPYVVASSNSHNMLSSNLDPLSELEFRPDRSLAVEAVQVGRAPGAEPWRERAAAALADLQAHGSTLDADG